MLKAPARDSGCCWPQLSVDATVSGSLSSVVQSCCSGWLSTIMLVALLKDGDTCLLPTLLCLPRCGLLPSPVVRFRPGTRARSRCGLVPSPVARFRPCTFCGQPDLATQTSVL